MIKISTGRPTKNEIQNNGLNAIASEILSTEKWTGYVLLHVRRIATDHSDVTCEDHATLHVLAAEPLLGDDAVRAELTIRRGQKRRTREAAKAEPGTTLGVFDNEGDVPPEDPDEDYGDPPEPRRPIERVDLPDVPDPVLRDGSGPFGGFAENILRREAQASIALNGDTHAVTIDLEDDDDPEPARHLHAVPDLRSKTRVRKDEE